MNTEFCTYFDKGYLVRGVAMLTSLFEHMPDASVTVLCLDKLTDVLLKHLFPSVRRIDLSDFECATPELAPARADRSLREYYWTLTPCLMMRLLSQADEEDAVVYLDADQLFFASPQPILNQLRGLSVLIQPHSFPKRLESLRQNGLYNVGVVGARRTPEGLAVMDWWKERCIEWCRDVCEPGRFGDQKYLEHFADIAPGVGVMRHPGVGVGPWNHDNASFSTDDAGHVFFGKVPLVVYHYHSFAPLTDGVYAPTRHQQTYRLSLDVLRHCYIPYIRAYEAAMAQVRELDASFAPPSADLEMDADAPFIARHDLIPAIAKALPHTIAAEAGGFCICIPQVRADQAPGNTWDGDYATWEDACAAAGTYNTPEILEKTLKASRAARDGKIVCERDSVALPQREYLLPTLSGILLGAARNGGELHLIDFGGALGSTYRTCRPFLRHLAKVRWHVVELPELVEAGRREFQTGELLFHETIEECVRKHRIDGILFGASLQYLQNPFSILQLIERHPIDYLVIDRTPFSSKHRFCVQHVPRHIYNASYPCHIFSFTELKNFIEKKFTIVDTPVALEGIVNDITFMGIIAIARKLQKN